MRGESSFIEFLVGSIQAIVTGLLAAISGTWSAERDKGKAQKDSAIGTFLGRVGVILIALVLIAILGGALYLLRWSYGWWWRR